MAFRGRQNRAYALNQDRIVLPLRSGKTSNRTATLLAAVLAATLVTALLLFGTFRRASGAGGSFSPTRAAGDAGGTVAFAHGGFNSRHSEIEAKREAIHRLELKINRLKHNTAQLREVLVAHDDNDTLAKITKLEQELGLVDGYEGDMGDEPVPGAGCTEPMVAIAVKTRHSSIADIEYFLDHHFSIGVCHVFIRIQHTPNLRFLLSESKYHGKVSPLFVDDYPIFEDEESGENFDEKKRQFEALIESEDNFVNEAIAQAERYGFQWVFALDDDELIYDYARSDISAFFKKIPDSILEVHLENYESVVDPDQIDTHIHHRFGTNIFFKGARLGHSDGRSAARVDRSIVQDGNHHFAVKNNAKEPSEFRRDIPPTELVVLHYESSDFFAWIKKFSEYRTVNASQWKWDFYRKSHEEIEKLREFYMSKKRASPAEARLDKDAFAIGVDVEAIVKLEDFQPEFYDARPQHYAQYSDEYFRVEW